MASSSGMVKKNIAIIGAGTGLTAAWALAGSDNFNVSLFEAQERLGGHIHSIEVDDVVLEGGAEFIGNSEIYPNVHRLFKHLGVELEEYELNIDFDNLKEDDHTIMPPIYHTSSGKSSGCFPVNFFRRHKPQPETHISFNTLLTEFFELLNMNAIINKAKSKLISPEQMMTLEEFVTAFINQCPETICHRQKFADELLYPLIAAGWGVSIETIKTCGAHYAMHYLASDKNWFDAVDGLSTYINALEKQSQDVQKYLSTPIEKIEEVDVDGQIKYRLLKAGGEVVVDDKGNVILYDDIVLTTPAYVSEQIIKDLGSESMKALHAKLAAVKYYDTTVVFHRDSSFESKHNTVVHTRFDGEKAANTMCKRWKFAEDETPVMKSWVLPGQPMPKNVEKEVHYRHPVMDKAYFSAQMALHQAQGEHGIWHGGILAGSGDSHESGVTVALQVASRLCLREKCLAANERLAVFPEIVTSTHNLNNEMGYMADDELTDDESTNVIAAML